MFTLLKRSTVAPFTVQDIHDAFDQAPEKLLAEVKEIIASCSVPTDNPLLAKASRLRKLGFQSAEPVNDAVIHENRIASMKDKLGKASKLKNMIDYYTQSYPTLKFITEEVMNELCRKYNLVYAPVSAYTKDVPDKNLLEIENAPKLALGHAANKIFIYRNMKMHPVDECILKLCQGTLIINVTGEFFNRTDADSVLRQYLQSELGMRMPSYLYKTATILEEDRSGLFIAASPEDFNRAGLAKTGDFGYAQYKKYKVKDPIVFRYCLHGIQILSKWGPEASDPLLVNEKMN